MFFSVKKQLKYFNVKICIFTAKYTVFLQILYGKELRIFTDLNFVFLCLFLSLRDKYIQFSKLYEKKTFILS